MAPYSPGGQGVRDVTPGWTSTRWGTAVREFTARPPELGISAGPEDANRRRRGPDRQRVRIGRRRALEREVALVVWPPQDKGGGHVPLLSEEPVMDQHHSDRTGMAFELRRFSITLATHDMARAVRFYRALGLPLNYGGE